MKRKDSLKRRKELLQSMEEDLRGLSESEAMLKSMISLVDLSAERREIIQRQSAKVEKHTAELKANIEAEKAQIAIEEDEMLAEAEQEKRDAAAKEHALRVSRTQRYNRELSAYWHELATRMRDNRSVEDLHLPQPPQF